MSKALTIWAYSKRGRVSQLARHLKLTQPAVTKMIDGTIAVNVKYAKAIIEFTGLSAKDIYPDHYKIFKLSLKKDEEKLNEKRVEIIQKLDEIKGVFNESFVSV